MDYKAILALILLLLLAPFLALGLAGRVVHDALVLGWSAGDTITEWFRK